MPPIRERDPSLEHGAYPSTTTPTSLWSSGPLHLRKPYHIATPSESCSESSASSSGSSSSIFTQSLTGPLSPLTEPESDDDDDAAGWTDNEEDADGETDYEFEADQHRAILAAREPDDVCDTDGTRGSIPLHPIAEAALRDPITIRGQELVPTIAFNLFFWFCAERRGIENRRRAGLAAPWTKNKCLQNNFFCNSVRVMDRTSQFLITHVIEKGPQDPKELLFRILLFSCFNKIETWQLLEQELAPLTWKRYKLKTYSKVLLKALEQKTSLFGFAYQKQACGKKEMWRGQLLSMQNAMKDVVLFKMLLTPGTYMEDVFDHIKGYEGFGPFTSFQTVLNLSYSSLLPASTWDLVVPGPGSQSGLLKMFGPSILAAQERERDIEQATIRWIAKHFGEECKRLGIVCEPLTPVDVEHAICETDKLVRLLLPSIKGPESTRPKMSVKRRGFGTKVLPKVVMPKAWAVKREVRVRKWEVDGEFLVECIKAHRVEEDGKHTFFVSWEDYPSPEMDSWVSEDCVTKESVQEYVQVNGVLGLDRFR